MSEAGGVTEPLVSVEGLTVELPSGLVVVEDARLALAPGTVTALLGPSGAGKTTLLRAIFSPHELTRAGYRVASSARAVHAEPAFVPQRGALLDHVDVRGNVTLAQAGSGRALDAVPWLRAVDLPEHVAEPGRSVATLSGGQAQRVAVARVLAAGRKLVVMDEPSVGLDPLSVRTLARLLVEQAREHDAAIVIITHDLALAGGAADEVLFLDPGARTLAPLVAGWRGPAELAGDDERKARISELELAMEARLRSAKPATGTPRRRLRLELDPLAPLRAMGSALVYALSPRLFVPSLGVGLRVLFGAFVRPALFYAVVGGLLGFTVPYVIANVSADLRATAVFQLVKGTYVLSLGPPISAIVFAATSGSATNAWLGGLRLHGQVTALEGLGVRPARYLFSPSWLALVAGYLLTFITFTAAMVAGGLVLYQSQGVPDALALLTADFVDPPPSRLPYLVRAAATVLAYGLAVASIVVAAGGAPKQRSDDVTKAMTSAVQRSTLFVVALELASIVALRAWEGR